MARRSPPPPGARAVAAEATADTVRGELARSREQADRYQELAGDLRGELAAVTAERDAARADIDRERQHGEQRVVDLRASLDAQVGQLREALVQARRDAQDQRSRADRAEAAAPPTPTVQAGRRRKQGASTDDRAGEV